MTAGGLGSPANEEWSAGDPVEQARLDAVARYVELPPRDDPVLDALVRVAAQLCDTTIACIAVVTATQVWRLARHGLGNPASPRADVIGDLVVRERALVVLVDASADPRTRRHPAILGFPHVRAYAGVPLRTGDGEVIGVLSVGDTAARQIPPTHVAVLEVLAQHVMTELELRRTRSRAVTQSREHLERETRGLTALTQAIIADLDTETSLALVIDRAGELLRVDSAQVLVTTEDGTALTVAAGYGLARDLDGPAKVPIGQGFAGTVAATREALLVDDAIDHPLAGPAVRRRGIRSLALTPIVAGGRLEGVVKVASRQPGFFTAEVLPLLSWISDRIGAVLERGRLQRELSSSRGRLEALVEAVIDPFATLRPVRDEQGRIIDFRVFDIRDVHEAQGTATAGQVLHVRSRCPVAFDLLCRVHATGVAESLHRVLVPPFSVHPRWPGGFLDMRAARVDDDVVVSWRDVSAQVQAEEALRQRALYDGLTALPNRALFLDRLHGELARLKRHRGAVGLIFLDLDHFKAINDRHGHAVGDLLLTEIAHRVRRRVRPRRPRRPAVR